MQCLNPINIKNPNYGKFWASNSDYYRILVPCGHCTACLARKRKQWFFRINAEMKTSETAFFVTLTYNDENYSGKCNKRDPQLFFKRVRKYLKSKGFNEKIKYFLVSEYGETFGRGHYHACIFGLPYHLANDIIDSCWSLGFVDIHPLSPAAINYVCKYCLQNVYDSAEDKIADDYKTFMLCSRRPAIGSSFMSDDMLAYLKTNLDGCVTLQGVKYSIPRYYEDKVFDDYQLRNIKKKRNEFLNKDVEYSRHGERIERQRKQEFDKKVKNKLKKNLKK
ncbi:replication initiator protein [Dipodfec virus UOA04_Rod_1209]|nr:replication initiator protein [Dipodfec virus UOA04_Rod_1209]